MRTDMIDSLDPRRRSVLGADGGWSAGESNDLETDRVIVWPLAAFASVFTLGLRDSPRGPVSSPSDACAEPMSDVVRGCCWAASATLALAFSGVSISLSKTAKSGSESENDIVGKRPGPSMRGKGVSPLILMPEPLRSTGCVLIAAPGDL